MYSSRALFLVKGHLRSSEVERMLVWRGNIRGTHKGVRIHGEQETTIGTDRWGKGIKQYVATDVVLLVGAVNAPYVTRLSACAEVRVS